MRRIVPLLLTILLVLPVARAGTPAQADAVSEGLAAIRHAANGPVEAHIAVETAAHDFIRATEGGVLLRDDARRPAKARATVFLKRFGGAVGLTSAERRTIDAILHPTRVDRDLAGSTHVRFDQTYKGLPVFGAELVVHLSEKGVTGVTGQFVPGIRMSTRPAVTEQRAIRAAVVAVEKTTGGESTATNASLSVYRIGLLEARPGKNALAWNVVVETAPGEKIGHNREQVWVDARSGAVLARIPLKASAMDRRVYSPQYDRSNPEMFMWRGEGDPETRVPMFDKLYDYTGQVYTFFAKSFGRDSFDAKGATMRTVYLVNEICPNAYWNGSSTNYCPGFDIDDVVAHEWAHAYTEHTHGLIYSCQSGALNESYSDIWGEVIDLTNGEDGIGGANNEAPYPDGQRWLVGEDLGTPVQEALLRDMWDPERLGDPAKVSSALYVCGSGDGFGVHTNSGVPNHAFATLVDGKSYNGVTVRGIGLTKASHIYYQAMTAYQTRSSKFNMHALALQASCEDLLGIDLRALNTGASSGERLSHGDCAQVAKAVRATELAKPPLQCGFTPMLAPGAPPLCSGSQVHFDDSFEDGLAGWTLKSEGANAEWPKLNWRSTRGPGGHAGKAAFAPNPDLGSCETGDDVTGRFWMQSRDIKIPTGVPNVKLRFDHWAAIERGADGGNLKVSINGGDFSVVPANAYGWNAPNLTLAASPMSGEMAWTGADGGETTGSWGTTVADLSEIAKPGDTIALRFDVGMDCASGWFGWYVDDVVVYSCPPVPAPEIRVKGGSAGEATKGPFTISWSRPDGGRAPDALQESTTACSPVLVDDAESGIGKWELSLEGTGSLNWETASDKPEHASTVFRVRGLEGATNAASIMTYRDPITIRPGRTTLSFVDWYYNEGDDQIRIEVSEGGTTWQPVYNVGRSDYAPFALQSYQSEALKSRLVDLSRFAGKALRLRFKFVLGPDDRAGSTPLGWYVDDVKISTESWAIIATVTGTSLTIPGRATTGTYCYRVRTSYVVRGSVVPGDWSAPVAVKVTGTKSAVLGRRRERARPLPATGVPTPVMPAFALLTAAGLAGAALRRRR